ncbi:MAG: hypothetical protein WD852_08345 [Methyloceanibacter sp.]
MHKMGNTLSVKTRLPLTAWVLAGFVTLFSLLSTLMQTHQADRVDAASFAQICQPDRSCDRSAIEASVIH